MVELTRPRGLCLLIAATTSLLAGCGASGTATNYDRSGTFTDIVSEADRSRPADLSRHVGEETLSGTATYEGVAAAKFGSFTATADANLVADFDNGTISGNMTDWEDGSPQTHDLRGEIALSNGTLRDGLQDGTFEGLVSGNLERTRLAEIDPITGRTIFYSPEVLVLDGEAEGTFYDSMSGEPAKHVEGEMTADYVSTSGAIGRMIGGFVAEK